MGAAILASSVDGCVRRFDIRMGRMYTDDLHHSVASLAISHDGLCVLAACLDSHLRLLDVQAGELLASYSGHTHEAVRMGCAFTADDQHVIGCSEDGEWDAAAETRAVLCGCISVCGLSLCSRSCCCC